MAFDWPAVISNSGSSPKLIATGNGLPCVEIFLPHDAAMLAGRNVQRQRIAVMHHDAITAEVDPAFFDIACDHKIAVPR